MSVKIKKPCGCTEILPTAAIFIDDNEGSINVKTSGTEYNGIDISNNANATHTHNYIINGTLNFDVSGVGGGSVTVASDVFTVEQVSEIQALITGTMGSVTGYTINEYELLYKLVIWGYIDNSYIRTVRPFVSYSNSNNTNNATASLNYTLPMTTITANKAALTMTTNPLAIIWSDGTVVNCNGVNTARTGEGLGNIYLFGNYTTLTATTQSISNIDVLNENLNYVSLDNNYSLNIQNSHFTNVNTAVTRISLENCTASKVDSVLNKYAGSLNYLNLGSTASVLNSVDVFTLLTYLNLTNTSSNITNTANNTLLNYLNLSLSNSVITDLSLNTLLATIILNITSSTVNNFSNNTLLSFLNLSNTNCVITDLSNNTLLYFLNLSNTNSTVSDLSNNTLLMYLYFQNVDSVITDLSSNTQLIDLNLSVGSSTLSNFTSSNSLYSLRVDNSLCVINSVNNLCRIIRIEATANTATNTNLLLQNLIDNPRTDTRQLTFTWFAGIDQAKVTTLVGLGWAITQIGMP